VAHLPPYVTSQAATDVPQNAGPVGRFGTIGAVCWLGLLRMFMSRSNHES